MLIFGASGHTKVIVDCLISQEIPISGIFDDDLEKRRLLGIQVNGKYQHFFLPNEEIIIGIGDNKIRKLISERIRHRLGKVFHSSAIVSHSAIIDDGTVIFHGAIIQSSSRIGKNCIINTNASVDHDCELGDFVHIAPNVTICGGVCIGSGSMIGAGSTIIPNVKIGNDVIVGAGSIVLRDVPNGVTIFGNPAKIYGK